MGNSNELDFEMICFKIDTEGLDYAVADYFGASPDKIEAIKEAAGEGIAVAWKDYADAQEKLLVLLDAKREEEGIEYA